MSLVHAQISLMNWEDLFSARNHLIGQDKVHKMDITCLVNSDIRELCINEHIQQYLQLPVLGKRRYLDANNQVAESDMVGPVEVVFEDRRCLCNALVLPGESLPILGTSPMFMMELVMDPSGRKLMGSPKVLSRIVYLREIP